MGLKILSIIISIVTSLFLVLYKKKGIISKLGTVSWAYILGICYSLLMNFAVGSSFKLTCTELLEILAYISVAVGIPLILFANNIVNLKAVPKTIRTAFLLLILSVIIVTISLYLIYTKNIENGKILSGMALAIYTGGTPNLNAVAYIFDLDRESLLAANLSDVVIGGVFYLFIIFISRVCIKNKTSDLSSFETIEISKASCSKKGALFNLLIALMLALISAGLGALIWLLTGKVDGRLTDYIVPVMMIGTSLGGIILSKNEKISSVHENDEMGQFFITLFSFAIASLIDIDVIKRITSDIFIVFLCITVATFFLHMLLCKLFKIDLKIMIVTSTAGIYGPAFIPGVCSALNADSLVAAGLIMGSLGYVIGTFLGCGITMLL